MAGCDAMQRNAKRRPETAFTLMGFIQKIPMRKILSDFRCRTPSDRSSIGNVKTAGFRMKITLSVILPVLNNRAGFVNAIDPLIKLEDPGVELVVIDGGSTDGTLEEIRLRERYLAYWESGKDSGIGDAFNRGILHSRGEFVAILNSDDCWEPHTLQLFKQYREQYPEASVFYGAIRYMDAIRSYDYVRTPRLATLKYRMSLFHPAMFIRRTAHERVGLYDTRFTHAMDSEWCHRAYARQEHFQEIPAVLANVSLGGVSDREYLMSLQQYRDSVILNRLCTTTEAWCYFFFFATVKWAMRLPLLAPIKRTRDRFISKRLSFRQAG